MFRQSLSKAGREEVVLRKAYQNECVTLRLSSGIGEKERVPQFSGLNWGQRLGRNQDQAYLSVPAEIQRSGFFPDEGVFFTIRSDDGEQWGCARRQANGKAIHTIESNAILGRYFRRRLGLENGELVVLSHLLRYGRTSIDVYRDDLADYYLDFAVSATNGT
ncbi:NgoFVII family restriction endonuclease [Luminiphilus sp.]|nr:restriction endonuclease PLD domain-containing protein [Luminiphilus sp.]MDA9625512.1 NgoFVII family restriction endonuclease [Luminiphilus sp.]